MDESKPRLNLDVAVDQQQAQYQGEWRRGPDTGVEFRMRPATYPPYRRRVDKLQRQWRKDNKMLVGKKAYEPIPMPVLRRCIVQAACDELITDWRNIVDRSEQPIAFSPATVFQAAAKLERLADDIFELVGDDEVELEEEAGELGGNSPRRSDTTPVGAP